MKVFFGRVFPLIFVIAGGGIVIGGVLQLMQASASTAWPQVDGRVRTSEVEYRTDSDGDGSYYAEVLYGYTVEGVEYYANRVAYGDFGSSDPGFAKRTVNRYPAGSAVMVHYDPASPERAVLEPGIHGRTWLLPGFGTIFLAAGLAMAVFLPRALRRQAAVAAGDAYDGPRYESAERD